MNFMQALNGYRLQTSNHNQQITVRSNLFPNNEFQMPNPDKYRDIYLRIFSCLAGVKDLLNISLVNHSWKKLAESDYIWRFFAERYQIPLPAKTIKEQVLSEITNFQWGYTEWGSIDTPIKIHYTGKDLCYTTHILVIKDAMKYFPDYSYAYLPLSENNASCIFRSTEGTIDEKIVEIKDSLKEFKKKYNEVKFCIEFEWGHIEVNAMKIYYTGENKNQRYIEVMLKEAMLYFPICSYVSLPIVGGYETHIFRDRLGAIYEFTGNFYLKNYKQVELSIQFEWGHIEIAALRIRCKGGDKNWNSTSVLEQAMKYFPIYSYVFIPNGRSGWTYFYRNDRGQVIQYRGYDRLSLPNEPSFLKIYNEVKLDIHFEWGYIEIAALRIHYTGEDQNCIAALKGAMQYFPPCCYVFLPSGRTGGSYIYRNIDGMIVHHLALNTGYGSGREDLPNEPHFLENYQEVELYTKK